MFYTTRFFAVRIFVTDCFLRNFTNDTLWILSKSIQLCQSSEAPSFQINNDGVFSFFGKFSTETISLSFYSVWVYFAADSWLAENVKILSKIVFRFSKCFFSIITSFNLPSTAQLKPPNLTSFFNRKIVDLDFCVGLLIIEKSWNWWYIRCTFTSKLWVLYFYWLHFFSSRWWLITFQHLKGLPTESLWPLDLQQDFHDGPKKPKSSIVIVVLSILGLIFYWGSSPVLHCSRKCNNFLS